MRKQLFLFLALALSAAGYSQLSHEYGSTFAFDPKTEADPKFVLTDNYNHYLLTVTNTDGMLSKHRMTLRKFDQKNTLVDTYVYEYPKLDASTLYNYLGSVETDGKVYVFTETYSGKAKKSVISKHEFDKKTGQFATTEIMSTPILSLMKSGNVSMETSLRGNFIAINYTQYRAKEEPEVNKMVVLDAKTLAVAWQKDFSFADKYVTREFAVSNSGKVLFTRMAKGMKKHNYLALGTADGQTEMQLDSEIMVQNPKVITIGAMEYLLAFNYPAKGIRGGDFENLLLFDLQTGRTIKNAEVSEFNKVKNIDDVVIRDIVMQNNEFHIFTEAKVKMPMATTPTTGGFGSGYPMDDFRFGPSYLMVMLPDGTIKSITPFTVDNSSKADLFHSYGITNVKGNYFVNTGMYGGFYMLDGDFSKSKSNTTRFNTHTSEDSKYRFINHLSHYFPDSKRVLLARVVEDDKMQMVNILGVN